VSVSLHENVNKKVKKRKGTKKIWEPQQNYDKITMYI